MKTNHSFLALLAFSAFLIFSACASSPRGVLTDRNGNRVAGNIVQLLSISDTGDPVEVLATTTTSSSGRFSFDVKQDTNASVIISTTLNEETLRGYWIHQAAIAPLHPLSEALVDLVVDITQTMGGRTLSDFSAQELATILNLIFAADISALDLTDPETVKEFVRDRAGRQIAEASGGAITASSSEDFEPDNVESTATFEQDKSICAFGALIYVMEGSSFRFDLEQDGSLCGNTHETLSNMLAEGSPALTLPDEVFHLYGGSSFPTSGTGTDSLEDEREIALGPFALQTQTGEGGDPEEDDVTVSRKVYVPEDGDYIRYLEIFSNTGTQDRTIDFEIGSTLLTGNDSALLTSDSNNEAPSVSDRFLVAYDVLSDRPTVGFGFADGYGEDALTLLQAPGVASGEINEVLFGIEDFSLPSGSTKIFMHFVFFSSSRDSETLYDTMDALVRNPDATGMTLTELSQLANFTPPTGTIAGEDGAVIGEALVTAENESTSEIMTVTASSDGSFGIPLATQGGDRIALTASDGLETTLTVE